MTIKVNEIVKSIQGESSFAGVPCVLVRLTGCNIRCRYCDTKYAYEEGELMTPDQVFSRVREMNTRFVEVTGGEPLLQRDVYPLIEKLVRDRRSVLIETNGTIDLQELSSLREGEDLRVILDIKTPGSGMSGNIRWDNLNFIKTGDEIKFVLCDREDYDWAVRVVNRYHLDRNNTFEILFSPVYGQLDPVELSGWILQDSINVRLNLQLHKLLWGETARGV